MLLRNTGTDPNDRFCDIAPKYPTSYHGEFWGDFSRLFCIRRAIWAHWGAPSLSLLHHGCKPSILTKRRHFERCFGLHVKKRTKGMVFCCSVRSPHRTTKPSWGRDAQPGLMRFSFFLPQETPERKVIQAQPGLSVLAICVT